MQAPHNETALQLCQWVAAGLWFGALSTGIGVVGRIRMFYSQFGLFHSPRINLLWGILDFDSAAEEGGVLCAKNVLRYQLNVYWASMDAWGPSDGTIAVAMYAYWKSLVLVAVY